MATVHDLLPALVQQESAGDPNALSPKGAAGLYQIMPETARDPGYGVTPLQGWDGKDPRTATPEEQKRFAAEYLGAMAALHGGDVKLALASYNAGPGAVQAAGNTVPNYAETQGYVRNITNNTPGVQNVATTTVSPGNAATDWRTRAQAVENSVQAPVQAPAATDWRSRAESVQPQNSPAAEVGSWRTRAQAVSDPNAGVDGGAGKAAVQGFNSAVPFGERIAAGLGAVGAKAYDATLGDGVTEGQSISDLYKQARKDQEVTAANHSGAYTGGAIAGIAATLPAVSTKVLTGTRAVTGARGAVNAVPEALGAVGNYVRGSKVAADAGTLAKGANVAGKAIRGGAVAGATGAGYGYSNSRNDLDSQAAVDDGKSAGRVSAVLGAALPVAGAVAKGIPKPEVSQGVKDLAKIAKDKFGIDLSIDQIAPTNVRNTVQKLSQNIPGSGVEAFQAKQQTQWMRGVAKTIGEDADNLQPEVINRYLDRASKDFDGALANKTIKFSQKDINAIADIAASSRKQISSNLADVVQGNVDDMVKNLSKFKVGNGGVRDIPGAKLASFRSQLVKELPNIDGGARQQVAKIIEKIDDVVGKHLTPDEVKQLATARQQWRNFRTLEPLLEKSADGTINPTQLLQKVGSSKYIKGSRKVAGEDDLVDLAKIGKQFMVKKGGSDTAQKLMYGGAAANLSALPFAPQVVLPAMAVQGATALANRGYQKLLNQSPKAVANLVNDTAGKSNAIPIANMLGAQITGSTAKP